MSPRSEPKSIHPPAHSGAICFKYVDVRSTETRHHCDATDAHASHVCTCGYTWTNLSYYLRELPS